MAAVELRLAEWPVFANDQVDLPAGGHVDDVELVAAPEGTEGVADVEAILVESVDEPAELVGGRVITRSMSWVERGSP